MSNTDFDDGQEVRRAPARKVVKKKKKTGTRARPAPGPELRAEAPLRRNAPRPNPRYEGTRDPAREPVRPGAVIATGRTGEQLTRRRTSVGDKFEIPKAYVPQGWDYQWNAVTVLNQGIEEIVRGDLQMYENGWRPVPSSRHPGHWTPNGHEGSIVVEGLRLEERPMSLTQDAKKEDTLRAKAQVRDRTDALRMTQKQLPGANVALQRGQGGGMRMEIDPALDIPRPAVELEE